MTTATPPKNYKKKVLPLKIVTLLCAFFGPALAFGSPDLGLLGIGLMVLGAMTGALWFRFFNASKSEAS